MTPGAFLNFAYGANMSLARLRVRTPSARLIGRARLAGHALRWHKLGMDGSGKCDAPATDDPEDVVWGGLFEILVCERAGLDRAEGLGRGYEERRVIVEGEGGPVAARMFQATRTDPHVRPFEWYKGHVLRGAHELALPAAYIARIGAVETWQDHDEVRVQRETLP